MRFSFFYYRLFLSIVLVLLLAFGYLYINDNIGSFSYARDDEIEQCFDETIPDKVYASGRVIGIHEKTEGVLVVNTDEVKDEKGKKCSPSKDLILGGDYITAINNIPVETKKEIVNELSKLSKETEENSKVIELSIERGDQEKKVEIEPVRDKDNNIKLGIWIKDDMAGIGTMTFYTEDGRFGALGHGIGDGTTDELLETGEGEIYTVSLSTIVKGEEGKPGELSGVIYCGTRNHIGVLDDNTSLGIYGSLDAEDMEEFKENDCCYSVMKKEEIEEGEACIISDISGEREEYKIVITDVNKRAVDRNDGIEFEVTDERLLELTGGIVQGMSGSPIIQNGKIVGAVTHVLVNDPTKGYGIFIENMLY